MSWIDIVTICVVLWTIGEWGPAGKPNLRTSLWNSLFPKETPVMPSSPSVTPPAVQPPATPTPAPTPVDVKAAKLVQTKDLLLQAGRLLLDTGNSDEAAKVFELLVEISAGGDE